MNAKELIKMVEEVSSLTHGHKRSKLACIFYVEFVIQLVLGCEKEEALKNFNRILNQEVIDLTEEKIKSTGYVIDTLEAALWVFFHTEGYQETILKAINLGGDTDTIAAITGGIAGVYYGFKDIPDSWIQSIAKKDELYQMFKKFSYRVL